MAKVSDMELDFSVCIFSCNFDFCIKLFITKQNKIDGDQGESKSNHISVFRHLYLLVFKMFLRLLFYCKLQLARLLVTLRYRKPTLETHSETHLKMM